MAKISTALLTLEEKKFLGATQTDLAAFKAAMDAFITKLNADFTAQNGAVTNSQLDTDYASFPALTLEQ